VTRFSAACVAVLAIASAAAAQDRAIRSTPGGGLDAPRGTPLSGTALDARTEEVGGLLRCPVCQGLSVADSPSTMARNMKAEVREKLAAGYDQEQILAHFERSYGEFVRLSPRMRGVNLLVWLGPLAALIGGGAVVTWVLKRARPAAGPAQAVERAAGSCLLPSWDTLPDDARLAAAVRRVRELAYGWPGGVPPKPPAATP
jgi:cytochrome c-type biogenesis protein CcmH